MHALTCDQIQVARSRFNGIFRPACCALPESCPNGEGLFSRWTQEFSLEFAEKKLRGGGGRLVSKSGAHYLLDAFVDKLKEESRNRNWLLQTVHSPASSRRNNWGRVNKSIVCKFRARKASHWNVIKHFGFRWLCLVFYWYEWKRIFQRTGRMAEFGIRGIQGTKET